MPKYIPNKTAEIEEIQNAEIRRLTKALEEIKVLSISWKGCFGMKAINEKCENALNPKQKGT